MEQINKTLGRLSRSPHFQKRYDQLKMEVLSNPDVQSFLMEHQAGMSEQIIEQSLMKLHEYVSQTKRCTNCTGLGSCQNMMSGYEPVLTFENGKMDLFYRPCPNKIREDERRKTEKLIKSIYVPKEILQATFADFSLDHPSRDDAFEFAERFASTYQPGTRMKGLYLHGKFGVGKSYLLGALANHLAEQGISSLIVYVPEFFREMKQSLGDHTLNEKLEIVKNAPVLMLDDIGAEAMTSWTRDEILGSLLQYRMHEQLPTFFSSNFDFEALLHHLTYSQRGEEEKIKAARIMERIKYLASPIQLIGPNRRHG
ncbi:primosomal protein DnaI [Lederbergia sp. NSJ-179]|uniref:primosomal protein DnaI n=1 Tax=Lederbergia sp. NSJ-179 TaxID=2931402 RepID=UPI001FD0A30D|nr:primosomal protein DnaI [Lederbergia sp. NSJ-179]MCJ7839761.1 primosomal protein DnaI [Lederbergia sp. NSJ-179]